MWIDIGSSDNLEGVVLISKNSPVLSGDSLVGVVDYVGKNASLVRLITDSGIAPAVRVARAAKDDFLLQSHINALAAYTEEVPNSFKTNQEKTAFQYLLQKLSQSLPQTQEFDYLAKGELRGHGEPLWRAPGKLLKGVGFNYDFRDKEGPLRDLRTGQPHDPNEEYTPRNPCPLLQVGDLLVTSGMDGVFPEGLKVATIHSIAPLREGAYAYELTAEPTAQDLLDLKYVFVLPPQSIQREKIPDRQAKLLLQLQEEK